MEDRLGLPFQPPGHHGLGDAISDSGHAKNPRTCAVRFRYLYRQHRRREVAPRRHPIPDLVQIVSQILLEVLDGAPVHARRPFIGPDFLPRLLHFPLRDIERFA